MVLSDLQHIDKKCFKKSDGVAPIQEAELSKANHTLFVARDREAHCMGYLIYAHVSIDQSSTIVKVGIHGSGGRRNWTK